MFWRYLILAALAAPFLPTLGYGQASDARRPNSTTQSQSGDGGEALPPDAGNAAGEFEGAQQAESAGNVRLALGLYKRFVKNYPFDAKAADAQFQVGQIYEQLGSVEKAFEAYSVFIQRYSSSPKFESALVAQVTMANQLLDGRKLSFMGMPIVSGVDKAQKMYQTIIQNAPFSKYAPMAQFNLGLAYEKQGKVTEAVNAYQGVLDKYANSDVCDDALYQIGFVYLRLGYGSGSQDLSALTLAKNTFEDFLLQYPKSEKAAQAEENLKMLKSRESGDLLTIARFYDKYKDYKAAAIYYNDVIRRDPNGEEAKLAKTRIDELRNDYGDDAIRPGPEKTETGEVVALRRRLQAQVETSALSNYSGPPRNDVAPQELPIVRPRLRTGVRDVNPLPAVEPSLPTP